MTVTYTHEVANARLGGFSRLLGRWRGSVYKLFYKEFLIYISFYALLSIIYRFVLDQDQRVYFEKLCLQFEHYTDLVPISFVLGFYVSIIIGRWWSQFENIPWPDRLMVIIGSNVHGSDNRGRLLRRTLVRYLNLAQVLVYRCVSTAVYKRFPTMEHVIAAGIMSKKEYQLYESVTSVNLKYWVPILWFNNLLSKARQEGRIYDDFTHNMLIKEGNRFRSCCGQLVNYDWISVPLVYTQVVTVAVYLFFCSTLLSRQYLDTGRNYEGHGVDLIVPIFTIGQFFFYVGWLKVAEQLINPFGEDDEDFEANWCIDRNLEVSLIAVDHLYAQHPKLERDKFWNKASPDLPYTAASVTHKIEPFMGSTYDMRVTKAERDFKSGFVLHNQRETTGDQNSDSANSTVPFRAKSFRPLPQKARRSFTKNTGSKVLSVSESSLLNESTSSDSSEHESQDEEMSGDDERAAFSDLATSGLDLHEEGNDITMLNDSNNNIIPPEVNRSAEENLGLEASDLKQNKISQKETLKPQLPRFPKDHNRPKQLNLNIQFSSHSKYPIPSSIRLHCDEDKFEDRKNAEKRVHLYERRRRKNRIGYPPKKRSRRSINDANNYNWIKKQQESLRRATSYSESPGVLSAWSESDIASGAAGDSPMGSLISCSTSIPSPRQLRWAFRSTAPNIYGDTTSIASTLTSPSGTEGVENEAPFSSIGSSTFNPSIDPTLSSRRPPDSKEVAQFFLKRSNSTASSGKDDSITPFTDDLRKRLQVVSNNSPTPSSPIKSRSFVPFTPPNNLRSLSQTALSSTEMQGRQTLKPFKGSKSNPDRKSNVKPQRHISGASTLTFSDKPSSQLPVKRDGKTDKLIKIQTPTPSTTSNYSESKAMRRNSSGIWKALKTWNTKRKETKAKEKLPLPMIVDDDTIDEIKKSLLADDAATKHSNNLTEYLNIPNITFGTSSNRIKQLRAEKGSSNSSSEKFRGTPNSEEIELGFRPISQQLAPADISPSASKQSFYTDSVQWESEKDTCPIYVEGESNPYLRLSVLLGDTNRNLKEALKLEDNCVEAENLVGLPTVDSEFVSTSQTSSVTPSSSNTEDSTSMPQQDNAPSGRKRDQNSRLCDSNEKSDTISTKTNTTESTMALLDEGSPTDGNKLVNSMDISDRTISPTQSITESKRSSQADIEQELPSFNDFTMKQSVSFEKQSNFGLEVIPEIPSEDETQISPISLDSGTP